MQTHSVTQTTSAEESAARTATPVVSQSTATRIKSGNRCTVRDVAVYLANNGSTRITRTKKTTQVNDISLLDLLILFFYKDGGDAKDPITLIASYFLFRICRELSSFSKRSSSISSYLFILNNPLSRITFYLLPLLCRKEILASFSLRYAVVCMHIFLYIVCPKKNMIWVILSRFCTINPQNRLTSTQKTVFFLRFLNKFVRFSHFKVFVYMHPSSLRTIFLLPVNL